MGIESTIKVSLDRNAIKPTRGYKSDAGMDLYAPYSTIVPAHGYISIDTGVHVQIPPYFCGLLVSKSGLNVKHDITSTGLIDSGYSGSIVVKLYNHGQFSYRINRGDSISQLVILPCFIREIEVVDTIEAGERGNNGFGSTSRGHGDV